MLRATLCALLVVAATPLGAQRSSLTLPEASAATTASATSVWTGRGACGCFCC